MKFSKSTLERHKETVQAQLSLPTISLDPIKSSQPLDHSYEEQTLKSNFADHLTELSYCMVTQKDQIDIGMEHADDISKLTSNHIPMESFKHHIPEVLVSRDLMINKHKTKQHLIKRTIHEWRKCKHLGNMFDTNEDIKRRKFLATNAANRIQATFDNKKLIPETKITSFRAYIEPIFLYKC